MQTIFEFVKKYLMHILSRSHKILRVLYARSKMELPWTQMPEFYLNFHLISSPVSPSVRLSVCLLACVYLSVCFSLSLPFLVWSLCLSICLSLFISLSRHPSFSFPFSFIFSFSNFTNRGQSGIPAIGLHSSKTRLPFSMICWSGNIRLLRRLKSSARDL